MNNMNRRSKGRPIQDREKKSHSRVIRFEPYMDERLTYTCRVLGISMSDAIRQGVILFLRATEEDVKRAEQDRY